MFACIRAAVLAPVTCATTSRSTRSWLTQFSTDWTEGAISGLQVEDWNGFGKRFLHVTAARWAVRTVVSHLLEGEAARRPEEQRVDPNPGRCGCKRLGRTPRQNTAGYWREGGRCVSAHQRTGVADVGVNASRLTAAAAAITGGGGFGSSSPSRLKLTFAGAKPSGAWPDPAAAAAAAGGDLSGLAFLAGSALGAAAFFFSRSPLRPPREPGPPPRFLFLSTRCCTWSSIWMVFSVISDCSWIFTGNTSYSPHNTCHQQRSAAQRSTAQHSTAQVLHPHRCCIQNA